ncbi:electron transfer flavoprotein subunit alpha/FixB family protein [Bacillus sp. sid0103]|uniref:electron transfer flavoprotein subunit alpha/FixB family protein n=1 Tax=Bacillus sp. sid0103 TaxID=2856337 RepID=UPI001C497014|nr:electron transfer flavoprotein subunit alpha/FixB family protein [Bacillus sp. sid0103]MBV7508421.1 electron transfer flavoprotein subunit alpha/FixB family protein [Bacillus sp. sid0103]
MMNNVLVFLEGQEGKLTEDSKNVLKDAKKLANQMGGTLIGTSYRESVSQLQLNTAGLDEYWEIPLTKNEDPCGQLAGEVVKEIGINSKVGLILAINNLLGESILGTAAASLNGVFFHSCRQVSLDKNVFKMHQTTYAGKVDEIRSFYKGTNVCLATIIPSGTGRSSSSGRNKKVENQQVEELIKAIAPKIMDVFKASPEEINLTEAELIVAMGDGIATEKGYKLVSRFAQLIGATLGASRVVVDNGFFPHSGLIGLTGSIVAPKIYIGIGVSGAPHHLIGIKESGVIVGINANANAPLIKAADIAIVGDAYEILPALIDGLGGEQVV